MKNLAVPLLLLTIAIGQAIRIESVRADEPVGPTAVETRADAVAKWHAGPYHIEPPDVLSIELKWEDFDAEIEDGGRLKAEKVFVNDDFLVGLDGAIYLKGLARIYVSGMTVEEVNKAIVDKLSGRYDVPQVKVKVAQYNSKVVYVIKKQPSGDFVARIPCTKETDVLQVLAAAAEDVGTEDKVYILSPVGHTGRPNARLEVDIKALLMKSDLTTNYDLLPGDRIFIVSNTEVDENSGPPPVTPPTELQLFAYHAPIMPQKVYQSERPVKLTFRIVDDFDDSFAEIKGLREGDSVIVDSPSILGLIRVLEKNKLARVIASPTITTVLGRPAVMAIEGGNILGHYTGLDRIAVEATATEQDESVLLATKVSQETSGKTIEHHAELIMKEGQTCVMRLTDDQSESSDAPHIYTVLTLEYVK